MFVVRGSSGSSVQIGMAAGETIYGGWYRGLEYEGELESLP